MTTDKKSTIAGRMGHAARRVGTHIRVRVKVPDQLITLEYPGATPDLATVLMTARRKAALGILRRYGDLDAAVAEGG